MRTKAQKEAGLTFDGEPSYSMPEDVSERDCSAPKGWTEIEGGKEAGHTPLPWEAFNEKIAGPNNELVASTQTGLPINEAIANARFICQAVNAHHELVALAKDFESYCELKLIGFRQDYPENHCMVQTAVNYRDQARAALAKAKGGV